VGLVRRSRAGARPWSLLRLVVCPPTRPGDYGRVGPSPVAPALVHGSPCHPYYHGPSSRISAIEAASRRRGSCSTVWRALHRAPGGNGRIRRTPAPRAPRGPLEARLATCGRSFLDLGGATNRLGDSSLGPSRGNGSNGHPRRHLPPLLAPAAGLAVAGRQVAAEAAGVGLRKSTWPFSFRSSGLSIGPRNIRPCPHVSPSIL